MLATLGKLLVLAHFAGLAQKKNARQVERRQSPRYDALENRAFVGWWANGEFVFARARIENISIGGVMLVVEKRPAVSDVVIRLEAPTTIDWTPMQVVWMDSPRVGLKFPGGCPFALFKAVRGCALTTREKQCTAAEFDTRDWH